MRTKLSERQPESIRVGSCRIKLGRGRGGACFGGMRLILDRATIAATNDGRSEATRPESRLAHESMVAGPS